MLIVTFVWLTWRSEGARCVFVDGGYKHVAPAEQEPAVNAVSSPSSSDSRARLPELAAASSPEQPLALAAETSADIQARLPESVSAFAEPLPVSVAELFPERFPVSVFSRVRPRARRVKARSPELAAALSQERSPGLGVVLSPARSPDAHQACLSNVVQ